MNQITGGKFSKLDGSPLANGWLTMRLSHDSRASLSEIGAGTTIQIPLDANGNVSGTVDLFPNISLLPAGSFFYVTAFDSSESQVWGQNRQTLPSSPSPFNLSSWVPGGGTASVIGGSQTNVIGGNFTYIDTVTAIASATLTVRISCDALAPDGSQIGAGSKVSVTLDSTGNIPSSVLNLWPNSLLQFSAQSCVYYASLADSSGAILFFTSFTVPNQSTWNFNNVVPDGQRLN